MQYEKTGTPPVWDDIPNGIIDAETMVYAYPSQYQKIFMLRIIVNGYDASGNRESKTYSVEYILTEDNTPTPTPD